jgi:threonine/homoserine/homoserine lactone efflux protein
MYYDGSNYGRARMDVLFAKALVIGFSIAAPVGPIGLLCIQRTLSGGRAMGLATGLGAAVADGVYGALAGFGVGAITQALIAQAFWLGLAGGALLVALGAAAMQRPASTAARNHANSRAAAFASTFALTLANPMTILSFVAVFASFGAVATATTGAALQVVIGVFLGSAAWWLLLAGLVGALRARIGPATLAAINRVAGVVVMLFGVWAIVSAFQA